MPYESESRRQRRHQGSLYDILGNLPNPLTDGDSVWRR